MKNKQGFTLIELVVTLTISAILALISVPSMLKWYRKDKFINQTREIVDTINDARAAALSDKKCSNGDASESWTFSMKNDGFSLKCKDINGVVQNDEKKFSNFVIFDFASVKINNNSQYETPPSYPGNLGDLATKSLNLKFSNTSGRPQIYFEDNDDFSIRKTKFKFHYSEDNNEKRTICFDRISGYPTISKTSDCAE